MKEQPFELLCDIRDGANSLQIEGGAHLRGAHFKKHFSGESLIGGKRSFNGGALSRKYIRNPYVRTFIYLELTA